MVVAETQAQAFDAAEAVTIEYEELPCVIHSEDAMKPGTPAVWDQVRDNILVDTRFGNAAETDQILANAPTSSRWHFIDRVTARRWSHASPSRNTTGTMIATRSTPAVAGRCAKSVSSPKS